MLDNRCIIPDSRFCDLYCTGISGITVAIASNPPGVEFTGFVEDIQKLYKRSRVVCCPILAGGGTRIKIIEAAAYEKPIVTTTIGLEGIKMSDGKEVLIRDDAKSFSKACVQLLKDRTLCERLGKAARKVAVKEYKLPAKMSR